MLHQPLTDIDSVQGKRPDEQDEQTVSHGIGSLSAGHVSNLAHVCALWTSSICSDGLVFRP